MARRYAGRGEPFEDLQQVARIGLINAVDRYNPGRGSFTAFAVTTVCGELKRHFRDKTWGTHVTWRLRHLSVDMQRATATLMNALHREPTIDELAEHLDVSEEQIRHACRAAALAHVEVTLTGVQPHVAQVIKTVGLS
jgi:RNA polymerase sigma-B factor